MLKNLKLGVKLGIGFGVVILISLILGVWTRNNLSTIKSETLMLSEEYVPEVTIANNIERNALLTMYEMRGYGLTEDEDYLKRGRDNLEKMQGHVREAFDLSGRSQHLVKLKEQISTVETGVKTYQDLVGQTEKLNNSITQFRRQMDEGAGQFIQNCNDFLTSQNEKVNNEVGAGSSAAQLRERIRKITWINNIIDLGNEIRVANFKSQALRSPDLMERVMTNFSRIDELIKNTRNITIQEDNIRQLQKIQDASNQYRDAMSGFLSTWQEREKVGAQRNEVGQESVVAAVQATSLAGIQNTQEIATEASQKASASATALLTGLALATLLGAIFAFIITVAITGPLNKGVEFAKKVSEGDLTAEVDVVQKDEIGDLANALREMIGRLRRVVGEVVTAAQNVSSGSEQLNSTAQEMSQGATEQASAAEEVSSSMEEMSANIQQNTDNAQQTEKIASKSATDARESGSAVTEAVSAMKEIAEKISIIQEIARQTNLLALNAAIEAARAGEHGKGFAVVASEVRKLAERSQTAAGEITELAKTSVVVAERAGSMLNQLVPDIQKTADLVQEISAASNEQNSGASQINKAIQQLDQVIQQNAGAAEEMASTAEELSSQAEQLQSSIDFFKVESHGTSSYNRTAQTPGLVHKAKKPLISHIGSKKISLGKGGNKEVKAPDKGINLNLKDGTDKEDDMFERY